MHPPDLPYRPSNFWYENFNIRLIHHDDLTTIWEFPAKMEPFIHITHPSDRKDKVRKTSETRVISSIILDEYLVNHTFPLYETDPQPHLIFSGYYEYRAKNLEHLPIKPSDNINNFEVKWKKNDIIFQAKLTYNDRSFDKFSDEHQLYYYCFAIITPKYLIDLNPQISVSFHLPYSRKEVILVDDDKRLGTVSFMSPIYVDAGVLDRYQDGKHQISENGCVGIKGYWGLGRGCFQFGHHYYSINIGDLKEGIPAKDWSHWRKHCDDLIMNDMDEIQNQREKGEIISFGERRKNIEKKIAMIEYLSHDLYGIYIWTTTQRLIGMRELEDFDEFRKKIFIGEPIGFQISKNSNFVNIKSRIIKFWSVLIENINNEIIIYLTKLDKRLLEKDKSSKGGPIVHLIEFLLLNVVKNYHASQNCGSSYEHAINQRLYDKGFQELEISCQNFLPEHYQTMFYRKFDLLIWIKNARNAGSHPNLLNQNEFASLIYNRYRHTQPDQIFVKLYNEIEQLLSFIFQCLRTEKLLNLE